MITAAMLWFVRYACKAMYPATGGLKGLTDEALTPFLREFLADAPFIQRIGLWASAWLFIWGPLLTVWVPLPAFLLPAGLRDRHAYRFATHRLYPIRALGLTLKMTAGMAWAVDPEVRRQLSAVPMVPDPKTFQGDRT